MPNAFVKFLTDTGRITQDQSEHLEDWLRHDPQPIGMIAMSHGLLTGNGIDDILQRQSETRELFGDVAIKMAHLTREQVNRLLEVQHFRRHAAVVEGLALSGQLGIEEAADCFAEFLRRQPALCGPKR